jgi:hypothetical protein
MTNDILPSKPLLLQGSFFASLSLSYSFPKSLLEKISCKGLNLSLTGQNLGYITGAKYLSSPERGGMRGLGYALPRTFLVGVDVTF